MPKFSAIAFKFIIITECLCGVYLQYMVLGAGINGFREIALIANLLCAIYYVVATAGVLIFKPHDFKKLPFPEIKGICSVLIAFTGIMMLIFNHESINILTVGGLSFFVVNILTPILVVTDWLAFDTNARWSVFMPLKAFPIPALYFAWIFITAAKMDSTLPLRYPYLFLDIESKGTSSVVLNVIILLVIFLLLGYLMYFIDLGISKYQGWLEKANENMKK